MPRKPRFIHPLRQLRACLGLTQTAFARLIGCSAPAIQRIENGTMPMSHRIAQNILQATGANPTELRAGRKGKALDIFGNPYTKEYYDFYNSQVPCSDETGQEYLCHLSRWIRLLLLASIRVGGPRTHALFFTLQELLEETARNFG
ncbi:MAG: helix-turn-helix transcriptional regulator, partial [Verrucomicrobia bacterium]|nr:helix-turn-helix transcriptional regulator [Verrucomicrobiota bacterium]